MAMKWNLSGATKTLDMVANPKLLLTRYFQGKTGTQNIVTYSVKRYLRFYLNESSFSLYNNAPITSRFQRYREEILFTCNGAILHDDFNILGLRIKVEKLRVVFSRQGIIIITAQSYIILELCVKSIFSFRNIEIVNGNSLFLYHWNDCFHR